MSPASAPDGSSSSTKKNQPTKITYCEGSPSWNPDTYLTDAELHARAQAYLSEKNDLRSAITTSFSLRKADNYVYHAIAAVTLAQVQQGVNLGRAHGLHNWYYGERAAPAPQPQPQTQNGGVDRSSEQATTTTTTTTRAESETKTPFSQSSEPPKQTPSRPQLPPVLPPPPQADIEAYLSIFSPANSASTALRNFTSNAKKGSLRFEIGTYLTSKRYIHPSLDSRLKLPRIKPSSSSSTSTSSPSLPANPYLTFLSWTVRNLEWAGPCPSSKRGPPSSHHVLPILMHHFGCVCPSHEALEILRIIADGREILDVGSGNGYWTRMLRDYHAYHHASRPKPKPKTNPKSKSTTTSDPESKSEDVPAALPVVTPIDSAQSSWRTTWVRDTLISDGETYLRTTRGGARDAVLLLVYPIVGGGIAGGRAGGFTRDMLDAYEGDTIAVVGTQNHNGYTGFPDMTMDEFMAREYGDEWVKVVQVPLPSFPAKDEALFVFQRGPRAPPPSTTSPAREDGDVGDDNPKS